MLKLFNHKTPKEVKETDAKALLERLSLSQHLSPGSNNGLHAMITKMKVLAECEGR